MRSIKTSRFAILLLLCSIIIYSPSCKKDNEDENPQSPENEIIISENAKIVDSTLLTNLQVNGTTYTFDHAGGTPNFTTGDIITGAAFGGYLRKVTSVDITNNKLIVETEDTKLVEAVENGDFQQNTSITFQSKSGTTYPNQFLLVNAAEGVQLRGNMIDLDGVILYEGQVGGIDVKLSIPNGSVEFTPEFDFGLKIRKKRIKELHTYAEGLLNMDFQAKLEAGGEFTTQKEINLATFKSYLVQFIGPWPVFEVITLSFDAGFSTENKINGEVNTGFNSTYQMKYGYEYTNNNGWEQIWEKSPTFTQYPVQGLFNTDLDLEVYIKPTLTIELYGVIGPGMDVRPYLNFAANVHNKNIYWNWDLTGGIDGHLLFNAHIFGWQIINYSKELFDWNTLIASDNGVIQSGQTPMVTTNSISNITMTSSTCGGNVIDQGNSSVTARGVCWSTSSFPTTSDSHTTNGIGTGSFTSNITGLIANTTYYVRAYATNSAGTTYGDHVSFSTLSGGPSGEPCPGTPTVYYEGQTYNTVLIGNQCWFKENLNVGIMINGTQSQTNDGQIEKYCYNNDPDKCATYGGLYQWDEVMQYSTTSGTRGICPNGWHIPTYNEWQELFNFLGGTNIAGGKLKEAGFEHWLNPNTGASNESGFTALPSGLRQYSTTNFTNLTKQAYFWTSTKSRSFRFLLTYNSEEVSENDVPITNGESVRCLQN